MDKDVFLLGASLPIPEIDSEENEKRQIHAFKRFVTLDILDAMGTAEFEIILKSSKDILKTMPLKEKWVFCGELLEKITELYIYEFPYSLEQSKDTIQEIFSFVEFMEYDYIDFFAKMWKSLVDDLRNTEVDDFVEKKISEIIIQIDSLVANKTIYSPSSGLINLFLGTINKEDLIRFITLKTNQSKMDIVLAIMEGELNDHSDEGNN